VNGIEFRWRPLRCEQDRDKDGDWYGEGNNNYHSAALSPMQQSLFLLSDHFVSQSYSIFFEVCLPSYSLTHSLGILFSVQYHCFTTDLQEIQ
jgi:hypothetical protein